MAQTTFARVTELQAIAPAAYTSGGGAQASSYIDLQGYQSALILVDIGAYTSGAAAITLDESNNGTDALTGGTDLDGSTPDKGRDARLMVVADANGAPVAPKVDAANKVVTFAYIGTARYIKVKVAAVTATYGVTVQKQFPLYGPARQPAALKSSAE